MEPLNKRIDKWLNSRYNKYPDGTLVLSRDMIETSAGCCVAQTREVIEPTANNLAKDINVLDREVRRLKKSLDKASPEDKDEIADRIKTKLIHIREMKMKKRIYDAAINSIGTNPGCKKKASSTGVQCNQPNLAFVDYCIYHMP